jgi:hypothetical protein
LLRNFLLSLRSNNIAFKLIDVYLNPKLDCAVGRLPATVSMPYGYSWKIAYGTKAFFPALTHVALAKCVAKKSFLNFTISRNIRIRYCK